MEKSHHELYCAAAIANIEGCKKLLLPLTDANETTRLPFLENRVRTALTVSLEVQKDYPEGFVFLICHKSVCMKQLSMRSSLQRLCRSQAR